jgi:N-acetylglucosamine-6-phosphate deacetylase
MTAPHPHAVAAATVFDGEALRSDAAVIIKGSRISWIGPRASVPSDMPMHSLPDDAWLSPGFIDLQVNGGGNVLFNAHPTRTALKQMAAAHRRFGTTSLLPTLISSTREKMKAALGAVQESRADPEILGLHFEGPFLSPEKPGVHDPSIIRQPVDGDLELLTSLRPLPTLVTLAPEQVPAGFIPALVRAGVRVSLGHSMATYAQTKNALVEGMTGFTHLFNAMRPLNSRDPGPIAAALETHSIWFGMIVDGVHVDPAMLRLALRGAATPFLVTDAMPPVGGAPSFMLDGQRITVQGSACARADGTLAGTALDMATAVRNCVRLLGLPLTLALRYASAEPAKFLGVDDEVGRLAPGCRADMVALDPAEVRILGSWLAGDWGCSGELTVTQLS